MSDQKKLRENNFDIREIYTPLSVAKKEIWKRWNDKELRKKVEDFLGEMPKVLKKEPRAVLARHIATPDMEYLYFNDLVKMTELRPLVWEYLSDKLYTVNLEKLHLCKIIYHEKKDGADNISSVKIVNFKKKLEGKPLCKIKTNWGENIVEFHHSLPRFLKIPEIDRWDASKWYKSNGNKAKENYSHFLALFIYGGILFENFFVNEVEKNFTMDVVIPAFKEVREKIGLKPLIVPLVPRKVECDLQWSCYSQKILNIIGRYQK